MTDSYPIKIWSGLLKDGHTKRIENALWEFIWLINKVTKEVDGIGIVLNGKPIKVKEICMDLEREYKAVWRHLKTLESEGYINLKRCPFGFLVTINNSKKFKNRYDKNDISVKIDMTKMSKGYDKNDISDMTKMSKTKKILNRYNNDSNNTSCQSSESSDEKSIKYPDNSIPYKLSFLLYKRILANNPKQKMPNIQQWAISIDLMIRIDKRTEQDIREVIEWCQKDSFWYANILSTKKLREKYDQLYIKMKGIKNGGKPGKHFENERDYTDEERERINKKFYGKD